MDIRGEAGGRPCAASMMKNVSATGTAVMTNLSPVQALQREIDAAKDLIDGLNDMYRDVGRWPAHLAALELAMADAQLVEHNNTCPIESGDCEILHDMQDSLGRCRAKLYEALQR